MNEVHEYSFFFKKENQDNKRVVIKLTKEEAMYLKKIMDDDFLLTTALIGRILTYGKEDILISSQSLFLTEITTN